MKHPKHLWFTVILVSLLQFGACSKAQVTSPQTGQNDESLQPKPFRGEVYETVDGRDRVTLTSQDEAEVTLGELCQNVVCKYTKQGDRLRIVVTVLGTTSAQYFQITTDGLKDSKGMEFLTPACLAARKQFNQGVRYFRGEGMAKDEVEAAKLFRQAAEQNYAKAQSNLGFCYANGLGVAKDEVVAAAWYRKAAEQNYAEAQNNLGLCYANGLGLAKDNAEAVAWYRKAAEQNYAEAQNGLAWLLATSKNSALRDGPNAVVFAEKAVAATNRKKADYLDTLAAAYAEAGQFEKAVNTEQEAIALLQTEAQKDDCRSRLRLYDAKSPYHAKD